MAPRKTEGRQCCFADAFGIRIPGERPHPDVHVAEIGGIPGELMAEFRANESGQLGTTCRHSLCEFVEVDPFDQAVEILDI
jgi:hypothetical protein